MDAILWQIPAGIGAILGLLLAGLSRDNSATHPSAAELVVVLAAVLVTYSLLIAMYKNRVFQVSRSIYIKSIYAELVRTGSLSESDLVPAVLPVNDYAASIVPGLSVLATKDLPAAVQQSVARAGGFAWLSGRLIKIGAFKTLFYVAVVAFLGEVGLFVNLLVRVLG